MEIKIPDSSEVQRGTEYKPNAPEVETIYFALVDKYSAIVAELATARDKGASWDDEDVLFLTTQRADLFHLVRRMFGITLPRS